MTLSPATSPPYLCLRVWSHSRDPLGHHSSGMNLVPNRRAPCFYLPGFFNRRETQLALDFDPPHLCRATQVPFRRTVLVFFPFSLVDRFLLLAFFMAPVVSTDYPILEVNWQPRSFALLAFLWDLVTDYAAGLSIRGGNLTARTPLFSVPG